MELAFDVEPEDVDAFYRRGNVGAWGLLAFENVLVVVGLVIIDWFFFRKEPVIGAVVNVAGVGLYVYRRWRGRHELHDRHVRNLVDSRQSLVGRHSLKMSAEGYKHCVGQARVTWRWEEVKHVMETDEHLFIRVGLAGATIIPKRALLDPAQLKWLRERLRSASHS